MASKAQIPVDSVCPLQGAKVHEDYDCMLIQTNIVANNNKFYVIHLEGEKDWINIKVSDNEITELEKIKKS